MDSGGPWLVSTPIVVAMGVPGSQLVAWVIVKLRDAMQPRSMGNFRGMRQWQVRRKATTRISLGEILAIRTGFFRILGLPAR